MAEVRIELQPLGGDGLAASYPVFDETCIGRDPSCELVLTDPSVSRRHCQLRRASSGWVLTDLGSSYGTWVNGHEITQVIVQHGDVIRIAPDIEMRFCAQSEGRRVLAKADFAAQGAPASRVDTHRRRRLVTTALYLMVLAGAAFGLHQWWGQRGAAQDQIMEVQTALDAASAHVARGDLTQANQSLAAVARAGLAPELRAALDAAVTSTASLAERQEEALGTLQSIALHPEFESIAAFEAALRGARPADIAQLIPDNVFTGLLAQGREILTQRAQAKAGDARARAQDQLGRRSFGRALWVLDEASRDASLDESGRLRLRSLRERVDSEARGEFESLRTRLRSAAPNDAQSAITQALPRFEGTDHEGELRALLAMIPLQEQPTVSAVPAAEVRPAEGNAVRDAIATAEGFAAKRDFVAAANAFAAAAETAAKGAAREFCLKRKARMERLAAFPQVLNQRVQSQPAMFRGISLGNESRADLKGVDSRGLDFQLGVGARMRIEWERFEPARQALVLHAARLKGQDARTAAEWLLEAHVPAATLTLLADVGLRDAAFRGEVADLVAEAKGLATVPLAGFEFHGGAFLTALEKSALLANRRIEQAAKTVDGGGGLEWRVALDELLALGDVGKVAARTALSSRRERLELQARSNADFSGAPLLKLRAKLRRELEEARAHALELIRDSRRYPYPYGPEQAAVQSDVDERVARVEDLWLHPSRRVLDLNEALRDAYQVLDETARALAEAGAPPQDPTALLDWVDSLVDLQSAVMDGKDAERIERRLDLASLVEGQSAMTPDERDCIVATNAYRIMMGFDPVVPDDRLVACAREHSDEMQRLGYFAHTSPTKGREGPGQRAKLAGWTAGVSENIALGQASGASAVAAWRHSSGHHRNLLGNWSHLGCGKASAGAYWTQNFSTGAIAKKVLGERPDGRTKRGGQRADPRERGDSPAPTPTPRGGGHHEDRSQR